MVTRIYRYRRATPYLRENRKAKGLSAKTVADRMGYTREGLLRLERDALTRLTKDKEAQYAEALGIEPAALWRPPGAISIDSLIEDQPADVQAMAADIVRRLVHK